MGFDSTSDRTEQNGQPNATTCCVDWKHVDAFLLSLFATNWVFNWHQSAVTRSICDQIFHRYWWEQSCMDLRTFGAHTGPIRT